MNEARGSSHEILFLGRDGGGGGVREEGAGWGAECGWGGGGDWIRRVRWRVSWKGEWRQKKKILKTSKKQDRNGTRERRAVFIPLGLTGGGR